jgi:Protein of unknown function (DUF4242)
VPLFLVERQLPSLTADDLGLAQRALLDSSRRLRAGGQEIRYLRSTLASPSGRCYCLFDAESQELVSEVNRAAQFPFTRIEEVLDLPAPRRPVRRTDARKPGGER